MDDFLILILGSFLLVFCMWCALDVLVRALFRRVDRKSGSLSLDRDRSEDS